MTLTVSLSSETRRFLRDLLTAQRLELQNFLTDLFLEPLPTITFQGGGIVIIIKDTNPDVAYEITPPEATDAEGQPVPAPHFNYEVTSTDPTVVEITPGADPTSGNAHFGAPGLATVNATVTNDAGDLLGSFAQSFTVTAGDPSAIVGGSIKFGDLVDEA